MGLGHRIDDVDIYPVSGGSRTLGFAWSKIGILKFSGTAGCNAALCWL